METLLQYYNKIIHEYADPRSTEFFMLGSPWPMILVLSAYWMFVKKIGPAWMKDRPPYDIKWIMQAYNLLQVAICAMLACREIYMLTVHEYLDEEKRLLCMVHDSRSEYHMEMMFLHWCYYMIKIVDLLDTVFFVLRKKFNQVTTLHTYHHISMIFCCHFIFRYHPAGAILVIGIVNSLVHTIMYFYYFYSANNSKSIWWKRYITQLQMAQFCFLLVWFTPQLFVKDCGYPKVILLLIVFQAIMMIKMFGSYYYNAFIRPKTDGCNNLKKKTY